MGVDAVLWAEHALLALYEIEFTKSGFGSVGVVGFRLKVKRKHAVRSKQKTMRVTYKSREAMQIQVFEVLVNELRAQILLVRR